MLKLGENLRAYLEGKQNNQEEEAAASAAMELVKKIQRDAVNGKVDKFLASRKAFLRQVQWAHSKIALKSPLGGRVGVPNARKKDGTAAVTFLGGTDEKGKEIQVADPNPQVRLQGDPEFHQVLATALLPRIINVLAQSREQSGLTADQVETCWVMLHCMGARVPIPEEFASVIQQLAFEKGEEHWRTHLAKVRARRPGGRSGDSSIKNDINRVRRLIATCLYLFVTLAPYSSVVHEESDMMRLLAMVFKDSKQLTKNQRALLRKAGGCVKEIDSAYRVDTGAAHAALLTLSDFKSHSLPQVVEDLHEAEGRYAINVPRQDRYQPRFDCVKRCAAHSSESTKP